MASTAENPNLAAESADIEIVDPPTVPAELVGDIFKLPASGNALRTLSNCMKGSAFLG